MTSMVGIIDWRLALGLAVGRARWVLLHGLASLERVGAGGVLHLLRSQWMFGRGLEGGVSVRQMSRDGAIVGGRWRSVVVRKCRGRRQSGNRADGLRKQTFASSTGEQITVQRARDKS